MTEKRYVEELWAYDDIMVKDNETGEELWNNMIYERMNEQNEKIKELEIELQNKTKKWKYELGMKLKYHSKLIDSEKENEQLKQENQMLKSTIGRNEAYITRLTKKGKWTKMTEKRYYSVDYDEEYYIFDSNVIRKGRVEEEAEYSYDVFANSMSSTEIIDKLNELTNENEQLKKELFESEKDYLIENYSDNPTRRDEKIRALTEEFKERFGDLE